MSSRGGATANGGPKLASGGTPSGRPGPAAKAVRKRRKAKPVLLGGGDYDDPTNPWRSRSVRDGRFRFLASLSRLVPDAEATLRSDVLPLFLLYPAPPNPATSFLVHWRDVVTRAVRNRQARDVRDALQK